MTEAEWLAIDRAEQMLLAIRDRVSDRKMRLVAVACCRGIWDRITDPRSRAAVEFAERFVEVGVARRRGRGAAEQAAQQACHAANEGRAGVLGRAGEADLMVAVNAAHAALATLITHGWFAAYLASGYSANVGAWEWIRDHHSPPYPWVQAAREKEQRQQVPLLCDIMGGVFRSPAAPTGAVLAWSAGTVPKLAQSIYDGGAFDQAPVLADALEEAGYADPEVLSHLRGPGQHWRGCWAVDCVLGKQ